MLFWLLDLHEDQQSLCGWVGRQTTSTYFPFLPLTHFFKRGSVVFASSATFSLSHSAQFFVPQCTVFCPTVYRFYAHRTQLFWTLCPQNTPQKPTSPQCHPTVNCISPTVLAHSDLHIPHSVIPQWTRYPPQCRPTVTSTKWTTMFRQLAKIRTLGKSSHFQIYQGILHHFQIFSL